MKLTASKTAINLIAIYCNKHVIAFEQQDKRLREGDRTVLN